MRLRVFTSLGRLAMAMTVAFMASAGSAQAGPFTFMPLDPYDPTPDGTPTPNYDNDGGPCCDLYNAYNAVSGASLTGNQQLDPFFLEPDHPWQLLGATGTVALIGLTAGNSNTLGYYTDLATGGSQTAVLGPNTGFELLSPFPSTTVNVAGDFGWYLTSDSGAASMTFFSDPSLNAGGWDHMITYSLGHLAGTVIATTSGNHVLSANAVLIGWEDLPFSNGALGDEDFDDTMYVLDSVAPIPEPTAIALLGMGLAGVIARRYRRRV